MSLRGHRPAFLASAVVGFSLVLAAAGATECPSDNVNDILEDPAVQDALKDAWEDSEEGTPDEHEEGGFVLECASISPDGTVVYELKTIRLPRGTDKELKPIIPKLPDGCRIIAFFHTHPGPEKGHPQEDKFHNDEPSQQDRDWGDATGLPGIIVYGTGPEYDDDTTTITFGRESPLDYCKKPEKKAAETKGDPHLTTFDGFVYSFQAVGEYIMATDGDIEVQARFEPVEGSTVASSTTALAVRLGASVAMVHRDGEFRLNGDVVAEFPSQVDGVRIEPGEDGFGSLVRFIWPDTTTLTVSNRRFLLNVRLETLRFGWEGLFGDGDEDPVNDLIGVSGPLEGRVDFEALYDELRPHWAVDAGTSLFSYRPGESNESFFDDSFPSAVVGFADFEEAEVEAAHDRCVEALVWLAPYLDNCMYDFLVTGAAEAVEAAADAHRRQYPLVDAGRIVDSVQFRGSVAVEGGGMIYLVEGDPGTLVSVAVDAMLDIDRCPRATAEVRLFILDHRGEEIADEWPGNTGCGAYGPWEIPDSGRVAILITSGDRFTDLVEKVPRTGSFSLTIGTPDARTEDITLGLDESTTVADRIAIPRDFVDYRVRGEPGDLVSTAVVSLNDIAGCERGVWDVTLTASTTDGTELGTGWPGNEGCRAHGGWEIPADGILTVRVQGGQGSDWPMTGTYQLEFGRYRYDVLDVDATRGPQRISGSVEIPMDGTVYSIEAPAGSQISVEVLAMNGQRDCDPGVWELRLIVSDSDGQVISEELPVIFGCGTFGPWTVPASGTLEVLARTNSVGTGAFTGTYQLEIRSG